MRNRLMLLAASILFAACADDQHATAPVSRSGSSSRSAGDVAPSGQTVGSPQAKPADQVGFTKVFTVHIASFVTIVRGNSATITATCPAGSVAIGGAYGVTTQESSAIDLVYVNSRLTESNGWAVRLLVPSNAVAIAVVVDVNATCMQ